MRFEICRGLLESWRHRLAGTAPRCPKIHDHGDTVAGQILIKGFFVEVEGSGLKQPVFTLATHGVIAKSWCRNTIHHLAMLANNIG